MMSKNCFISHSFKNTEHRWSLLVRHRSSSKASVAFIGFLTSSFCNISRWHPHQFRNGILLYPTLQRTLHKLLKQQRISTHSAVSHMSTVWHVTIPTRYKMGPILPSFSLILWGFFSTCIWNMCKGTEWESSIFERWNTGNCEVTYISSIHTMFFSRDILLWYRNSNEEMSHQLQLCLYDFISHVSALAESHHQAM